MREPSAFGGSWTEEKLRILGSYLDTYTTALKNQPFTLVYVDAFAGSGSVHPRGAEGFLAGSAEIAVNVNDRPFDRLLFIEKDPNRCAELDAMMESYPGRNHAIHNGEANESLLSIRRLGTGIRGVLFLDPFATEVQWSTVERIASWKQLDLWILFPIHAVARMLPTDRLPTDTVERLNQVFGDDSWNRLYEQTGQSSLFGRGPDERRQKGVDGLVRIYKQNLSKLFGQRFLEQSRRLTTEKNVSMFEFIFCVGSDSPKAIAAGKRIAKHIIQPQSGRS